MVLFAAAGFTGLAVQAIGQPANHPQAELARSVVSQLDGGAAPAAVVPSRSIDIGTSTDLYVIVTDAQREVLASSGSLDGKVVLPPAGVFDFVRTSGEDRVTWQPATGVRSWIVVDSFSGGFVIAGRSPSDSEQSELLLLLWGSFAALALAGAAGVALIAARLGR